MWWSVRLRRSLKCCFMYLTTYYLITDSCFYYLGTVFMSLKVFIPPQDFYLFSQQNRIRLDVSSCLIHFQNKLLFLHGAEENLKYPEYLWPAETGRLLEVFRSQSLRNSVPSRGRWPFPSVTLQTRVFSYISFKGKKKITCMSFCWLYILPYFKKCHFY